LELDQTIKANVIKIVCKPLSILARYEWVPASGENLEWGYFVLACDG